MNLTLDGEVVDISLTGISVAVDLPFLLIPQERLILEAKDSHGKTFRFETKIHRATERHGTHVCGAEFVLSMTSAEEVIGFVYGDSQRWQNVWHAQEKTGNTTRMVWHFTKLGFKGLRGSALALYSAVLTGLQWLRIQAQSRIHQIRIARS